MYSILAIILYFLFVFVFSSVCHARSRGRSDFVLGNRSLNYWITALAAHASDMSQWLFMGYPALIFINGLFCSWTAVGLLIFMYLNWCIVAPKIRVESEKLQAVTFFSFIEKRFNDQKGLVSIVAFVICTLFYCIYISSGLVGLGILTESLFGISYELAVFSATLIVIFYVIIGGFTTLAWIDFFQGLFLIIVISFVPCALIHKSGGWASFLNAIDIKSIQITKSFSWGTSFQVLLMIMGWGLGYFGQPAIITKFMGINDPKDLNKSKFVGMGWMTIALLAATLVGLVGKIFGKEFTNPEMLFIEMTKQTFGPFLVGLILCAIFAATLNVISSQVLIISSSLSEDIYKKIFPRHKASTLLIVMRLSIIFISLLSCIIAIFKISSIYSLVLYAWSGLGAAFGPLLIFSLYAKKITKRGALAGIISGSAMAAIWPGLNVYLAIPVDTLVIGAGVSSFFIWAVSRYTYKPEKKPVFLKTENTELNETVF